MQCRVEQSGGWRQTSLIANWFRTESIKLLRCPLDFSKPKRTRRTRRRTSSYVLNSVFHFPNGQKWGNSRPRTGLEESKVLDGARARLQGFGLPSRANGLRVPRPLTLNAIRPTLFTAWQAQRFRHASHSIPKNASTGHMLESPQCPAFKYTNSVRITSTET